jgi:hypothetical protein
MNVRLGEVRASARSPTLTSTFCDSAFCRVVYSFCCPLGGARCTPLVQRVSLCIDVATRSMAGKGTVHFMRCGVGNSYYDVASPGEAQIAHTVYATVFVLHSQYSGNLSCVVVSVIYAPPINAIHDPNKKGYGSYAFPSLVWSDVYSYSFNRYCRV